LFRGIFEKQIDKKDTIIMLKILGYLLILVVTGWFLYVTGTGMLDARKGQAEWNEAAMQILVVGVAPLLVGVVIGGGLIFWQGRHEVSKKQFENEQMLLHLLQKERHLQFRQIMLDLPLSKQEVIDLLVAMGRKKLFQGGIDPKFGRVVLLEAMDREIEPGECPFCQSLTSGISPEESVCTKCEAHLFHPALKA